MDKTQEALKLALECIEAWDRGGNASDYWRDRFDAITAIREALAERCVCGDPDTPGTHRTDGPCLAEQPAQQQEPVAWRWKMSLIPDAWQLSDHPHPEAALKEALYPSPPASKPWVGLTDEEIQTIWRNSEHMTVNQVCRAIEAKLREKNA